MEKSMRNPEKLDHSACTSAMVPVRDALDLLSGKWKLPIIIALTFGAKRFGGLSREIPKITDRMLSKELRDLEINGLVNRTVHDSIPVVVEYSLTEYGYSLDNVIKALHTWGTNHRQRYRDADKK
ncbi:MAG: helix-turn-helix domain-containing protein [Bacteroidota bacterium]